MPVTCSERRFVLADIVHQRYRPGRELWLLRCWKYL